MLNVGFIGCGSIGRDHIERVRNTVAGGRVAGVFDVVDEAARKAVSDFEVDAKVYGSAQELIDDDAIDVVVVASRNDAHLEPILRCIEIGKNVLTEKPLTKTSEESRKIVDAEVAAGRRFVQVGFNRRYDPGYRRLKAIVESGEIGSLLLSNCRHYNAAPATSYYKTDDVILDTFIHEIDVMQWLFGENYAAIEMKIGKRNSLNPAPDLDEPQLAIVETESGAIITVEININCQYGYDIQCRLVGESGIVALPDPAMPEIRKNLAITREIDPSWTARFEESYNEEFKAFFQSVARTGGPAAIPTAWDGYIANITGEAALASLHDKRRVEINIPEKPDLYK
ncbi:Gfo/Idh/MocA family protein [Rarobacter incanus]|uniref:Myo-inositol 2-dehydrogenase n=1 Tax=Rarobacter incanus TaxID=153494 RepID=A0A542SPF8_9MICO|nr:Gfo/Idh/MocA family oxidoreductase [Rarobacter incanus]TQK76448.1 myo-inositol 2-dehydrogenase [Rarobacter incanus]